jgi:hypothetical protein
LRDTDRKILMTTSCSRSVFAAAAASGAAALLLAVGAPSAGAAPSRADLQDTLLISRSMTGGVPNGPSSHAVISNDKRYARVIAYESEATDLVPGDTNGVKDVFATRRTGSANNMGSPWSPGPARLMSRGVGGAPANGPSWGASVSGGFHGRPNCVGFLSAASNLVGGDTNGQVDAFVTRLSGGAPKRVSLPFRRQSSLPTTAVAVSSNCKKIAFVTGGELFVRSARKHKRPARVRRVRVLGPASDPSFSTGLRNDLVFAAARGVYLLKKAAGRPRLVGPGGRNPVYNDIKRQVLAYERTVGGRQQIIYKEGRHERVISSRRGRHGNGDSRHPVIGNAGYYVTFESDASNLGVNSLARTGDANGRADIYLYTDVRKITMVESAEEKALPMPGGGRNPSMSFYANYITFDSPASGGGEQVYMRYLGPV